MENLLRHEDGVNVTKADIEALATWDPKAALNEEITFTPARVLMQDFTGVPAVVDLAAMREAMQRLGGDPAGSIPCLPPSWSSTTPVQVDVFGSTDAVEKNAAIELERAIKSAMCFCAGGNRPSRTSKSCRPTRASSIRSTSNIWPASSTLGCQRNRPSLSRHRGGTDSRTTMIDRLGVWLGVGGIEAEAAMSANPITMLIREWVRISSHRAPAGRPRPRPISCSPSRIYSGKRAWSVSSSNFSARDSTTSLGQSGHDRQYGARVRRDLRNFSIDEPPTTCGSPAATRNRSLGGDLCARTRVLA